VFQKPLEGEGWASTATSLNEADTPCCTEIELGQLSLKMISGYYGMTCSRQHVKCSSRLPYKIQRIHEKTSS
jgi:hypothetical protein